MDSPELAVAMGAAIRAAALGIAITDDDRTARVAFRGLAATGAPVRTISGRAEAIGGKCDLAGSSISLSVPGTDLFLEAPLADDGAFTFRDVPAGDTDLDELTVSLTDAGDRPVITLRYSPTAGEAQRRIGSEDFSTAVLPMPILLEGREGGQLTQRELLPEGEQLPAGATFTFYLADRSGVVRLPIFQGNRVIKEIIAEVPETLPVGTPLLFRIRCDRQARITVEGRVGDRSFGGSIEPPPPETPPREEEIDAACSRFRGLLEALDAEQQAGFEEELDRLLRELREAQLAGDNAMAIQRMADIHGLLKRMELERPLRPPLEEALGIVERCEGLWEEVEGEVEGLDEPRFREFCASTRDALREAYVGRREREYQDRIEAARTMARYLHALSAEEDAVADLPPEERADRALDELGQRAAALTLFAMLMSDDEARHLLEQTLATISDTRREWDAREIGAEEVLRRCQVVYNDTSRVAERLRPDDEEAVGQEGYVQFQAGGFDGSTDRGDIFGAGFERE